MENFDQLMGMLFGIVKAVLNFFRAVGKFDESDLGKLNGILGKINKGAGEIKDMKEEMENI
ncbi:MAG: hypothetical protein IKN72_12300 [Clostridia bacterium]|nr:hypothetical protein [Clostridia bacterium]MBR3554148.1 hypothetical protein [Clostridia bacterium]